MIWRLRQPRCAAIAFSIAVFACSTALAAQQRVLSGVLVDAYTQQPIAGAQIRVSGFRPIITDGAGRFRITNLPDSAVTLVISADGYQSQRSDAAAGSTSLRIELRAAVVALDQMIVTGTAGEAVKRAIGHSVTKIDAERQLEHVWVPDVTSLINGRAAGVSVMPGSGQLGAGPAIQFRGARTFSSNRNPLLYVDGVRVDNEVGSGLSRVQGGSGVANRLNDLSPEEIESIEIIKGPAAATLYGTEATNGVIQIITKSGRAGARPEFGVTMRQGATWFMNPEGRIAPNWGVVQGDTIELDLFAHERASGRTIFRKGRLQGYTISARGGGETVRYFTSVDLDRDDGIEPTNDLKRLGGRASLSITPNDRIDITATSGFSRGHTRFGCEGTCPHGVWFSLIFGDPITRDTVRRGFRTAPPEFLWRLFERVQSLDRSQVAVAFKHRPAPWFSHRLTIGEDRTHEDNQEIIQRNDSLIDFFNANLANGEKTVNRRDVTMTTLDYSATSTIPLARWVESVTSATTIGVQYYHKQTSLVGAFGDQFPESGFETISSAAVTNSSDGSVENNTLGFYAQQQFAYRDHLFLTAALRADDNSAFGKDFDIVSYPKISAAWVLHEEPWWRVPLVDAFRLRLAYGASGQQPPDFATFHGFAAITDGAGNAAITPRYIGNDSLAPERGEELELGFESALLNQRIGIDFTYYVARTRDAILLRNRAPSLGFPGGQFVNAGEIRNRGAELQLRSQPLRSHNVTLDAILNLATSSNEIVDLGGIDQGYGFVPVPGPDRQRHVPGFPVGAWFTRIVVSADVDPVTGQASSLLCDGGAGPRLRNGDPTLPGGSSVACDAAPVLYVGRPFPNLEGSFEARVLLFRRVRVHGLVDFKSGHKKLDNTLRDRCSLTVCRQRFFPLQYDARLIAEMQNTPVYNFHNWLLYDASFAKLREPSASYALPDAWTRRIGARRVLVTVTGRNLHTWARHGWLDPEAEFIEGTDNRSELARQELAHAPQLAQFIATFHVTF